MTRNRLMDEYSDDPPDPLADLMAIRKDYYINDIRPMYETLRRQGEVVAEDLRGIGRGQIREEVFYGHMIPDLRSLADVTVHPGLTVDKETALDEGLLGTRERLDGDVIELQSTDELKRLVVETVDPGWDYRAHGGSDDPLEDIARMSVGTYRYLASAKPAHPLELKIHAPKRTGVNIRLIDDDWAHVVEGVLPDLPGFESAPTYTFEYSDATDVEASPAEGVEG